MYWVVFFACVAVLVGVGLFVADRNPALEAPPRRDFEERAARYCG